MTTKNIWSLLVLTGLCTSCTDPLDVPTREYISFHYPFFETIHFEQDKVFLTQYRPEIQGDTLRLSAQQGKVSDYERSGDSFFLESSISPEGAGTLLVLNANGEVLGYGNREYYSSTIPETEEISYETFLDEIKFSEFRNQGTLSSSINNAVLEFRENSMLIHIEELDADVELVNVNFSLSKEEFNRSKTHYSDDLGIGYVSSTTFRPIQGLPSTYYNLAGEGDSVRTEIMIITSAASSLSFEEISIFGDTVFHAAHLIEQDLVSFSDTSETLLTEAEWDQEISRLQREAQERAVAEETARLEALEQQRLAAVAQERQRLEAEAEAAAENQEIALRALAPALSLLGYIANQEIPPTLQSGIGIESIIAASASFRQPEIPVFESEILYKMQELQDYVYPEDGFVADFIKGEELVNQLYEDFYENAANDEKRLILGFYANIYLAQEKYPAAKTVFEEMLTLGQLTEANQSFLNYSLSQLNIEEQNWQEVINLIQQLREDTQGEDETLLRQLAFAYFKSEQPKEALASWLAAEATQVDDISISREALYYLATFPEPEQLMNAFDYLLNTQQAIQDIREYGSLLAYQTTELNWFAQDLEDPDFVARISQMQASTELVNTSGTDRISEYSPSPDIRPISIENLDYNSLGVRLIRAVAPDYPTRAAQRGIQGWCVVSFTVDGLGNVAEDTVTVVDSEPPGMFDRQCTRTPVDFAFIPKTVRGEGVPVSGITYNFRFTLEGESNRGQRPIPRRYQN